MECSNDQSMRSFFEQTETATASFSSSFQDERLMKCNIGNRYLLWHGTSICNLISILSRGTLGLFSLD